jgi:ADP-ribose pyrophosphatase YjhB (NUDIX family)
MKPGVDYVGLGVGALIVRDNKALMLLRTDRCRNNRGLWTIPGGMAEQPETLEAAVRREALEEAGIALSTVQFLALSDRFFDGQHWVSALYLCTTDEEPVNIEPHMHSRLAWMDIDHLPENVTAPSMDAINAYRNIERN